MEQITKHISSEETKKLVEENKNSPDFVILDVRTKEEFDAGHLEHAVNLDFYSEDFPKMIGELDKTKKYLVYCQKGGRSEAAAEKIMEPIGFKNIFNLKNGFGDWESKKYPVLK